MKFFRSFLNFSCFLFLLFSANLTSAQASDSMTFVNTKWQVEKIKRGVKLYTKQFEDKMLFNSNQFVAYAKIKRCANYFGIAAEPKKLRTTSDFAQANNAVVAINGNFFDVKNGGAVDFTKQDGRIINVNHLTSNGKLNFHQKAAVTIRKGKLSIQKGDEIGWEQSLAEDDVMLNGPLLLLNRVQSQLDSTSSFTMTRHPRTCLGITKRGDVIMLVADGRNAIAQGLNLFELLKIMRWLGCVSAINFDGGGSSTIWVKGKGVTNHPSDNAKWDHAGERKVANILYLKTKR